jgi:hypothetical protein
LYEARKVTMGDLDVGWKETLGRPRRRTEGDTRKIWK